MWESLKQMVTENKIVIAGAAFTVVTGTGLGLYFLKWRPAKKKKQREGRIKDLNKLAQKLRPEDAQAIYEKISQLADDKTKVPTSDEVIQMVIQDREMAAAAAGN